MLNKTHMHSGKIDVSYFKFQLASVAMIVLAAGATTVMHWLVIPQ